MGTPPLVATTTSIILLNDFFQLESHSELLFHKNDILQRDLNSRDRQSTPLRAQLLRSDE